MNTKTINKELSHPAVTVTVLIFSINNDKLSVIVTKRIQPPFKNAWSIPGGLIHIDESLDDAARRILEEKTGIKNVFLEQLYTFGDPKRDPRERRISVSYYALLPHDSITFEDKSTTQWQNTETLPALAFDHNHIVTQGLTRIKERIASSNVASSLLPEAFRLSQLQNVFEIILCTSLDKRNFRKKILSLDLLEETGKKEVLGRHRPAMLYRFKTKKLIEF